MAIYTNTIKNKSTEVQNAQSRIATIGTYTCDDLYLFKSCTYGNGRQNLVNSGNGRQWKSTCFKMAARLAVRSENKLLLEEESFLAKMLNLKPACSRDYTGKPILLHTRRMSVLGR